jgi:hypothetical protein
MVYPCEARSKPEEADKWQAKPSRVEVFENGEDSLD